MSKFNKRQGKDGNRGGSDRDGKRKDRNDNNGKGGK